MSSLVSDEEEEDHHTKSLEVPESFSLEEYIQVQAGDDFSPPLIHVGTKMLHLFQISLLHIQVCYQKCIAETIGVD